MKRSLGRQVIIHLAAAATVFILFFILYINLYTIWKYLPKKGQRRVIQTWRKLTSIFDTLVLSIFLDGSLVFILSISRSKYSARMIHLIVSILTCRSVSISLAAFFFILSISLYTIWKYPPKKGRLRVIADRIEMFRKWGLRLFFAVLAASAVHIVFYYEFKFLFHFLFKFFFKFLFHFNPPTLPPRVARVLHIGFFLWNMYHMLRSLLQWEWARAQQPIIWLGDDIDDVLWEFYDEEDNILYGFYDDDDDDDDD